jgi:hypothetical protein
MVIDLDLTRELRGVDGLRSLVHAIVAADPSDEALWVEWKTDIDLTDKSGCMKVASAILGMANRPVEEAARVCEGFGYLIVGAEPGNLVGVYVPDPADWVTRVEQYLKSDVAPIWIHTTIPVDGLNVLVVTVDPPKHGDPIWTLRKELTPVRSGTVFVRKPGKTERATADDMDALQQRLIAGGPPLPDLVVEIVGDVPVPWLPGPAALEHASAWARSERDRHAAEAQAVEEERNQPARTEEEAITPLYNLGVGGRSVLREAAKYQEIARTLQNTLASSALARFQNEPDQRTLDEYLEQLEEWAGKLERAAHEDLLRRYFERGNGVAQVKVTNNSTQYLPDVEVRLHIDVAQVSGFEEIPPGTGLPAPPRAFGQPKPTPLLTSMQRPYLPVLPSYDVAPHTDYVRDTTIEDGSIHLTLDAGEIRPRRQHTGDEFCILLLARPDLGKLPVTWFATVKDRDWIVEGAFDLPVQEDPIHVPDLFADEEDEDIDA